MGRDGARADGPIDAVVVTHSRPFEATALCNELLGCGVRTVALVSNCQVPSTGEPRLIAHVNAEPLGYGANVNLGLGMLHRQADPPEVALLLNDDIELCDGSIEQMVAALEDDPSAGLVGPRLVGRDGVEQKSWFRFPTVTSEALEIAVFPRRVAGALDRWSQRFASSDRWQLGAAMLVRTSALREVGGFDERFFLYCEETDLCARLIAAGWKVSHVEDATLVHWGSATLGTSYEAELGRSRSLYVRSHFTRRQQLLLHILVPPIVAWNGCYVLAKVAFSQASARDFRSAVRGAWVRRPTARSVAPRHTA